MISIIIPTQNRAYTLNKVLPSYYDQEFVTELIIVDDFGNDETESLVEIFAIKYPHINTKYICHQYKQGAAAAKITGYRNAVNEYILFGEDDAYLENNYCKILLNKLLSNYKIGIVSGRIIYKFLDESNHEALGRFGYGFEKKAVFNKYRFAIEVNAVFENDIELPMTHALFLTTKSLLEEFEYDSFYAKGNGYREESDFQLNAFTNGYKIICTNDTHCFHMSKMEAFKGGQRINRLCQLFWNIYFTKYLYGKYFDTCKKLLNIHYDKHLALFIFSISTFFALFIQPIKKIPIILKRKFIK